MDIDVEQNLMIVGFFTTPLPVLVETFQRNGTNCRNQELAKLENERLGELGTE